MTTTTKQAPKKPTAVEKLQPSVLKPQLELMGDDVDITKLYLSLNGQGFNMVGAVEDVQVSRTIEGASTVTVTLEDRDRKLLRSGILSHRLTTEIDGLFFILVSVEKQGSGLTLVFEDREVYLLRTYNKPIVQSRKTDRANITRAEFVLRLIKEVKETRIKYVIPELTIVQPIGQSVDNATQSSVTANRSFGIPRVNDLTVKGVKMSEEQRKNANSILDVGASRLLPHRELVMSIMCVIQESSITNLGQPSPGAYNFLSSTDPNSNPVGCFQQIKKWGWPASRDVETDAAAFFDHLAPLAASNPNMDYGSVIDLVQNSGNPKGYDQWRNEGEAIANAYGVISTSVAVMNGSFSVASNSSNDYEFYRGLPPTSTAQKKKGKGGWGKESSWDCIQRLAQEVQWRAFFVSGVFYYISDEDLFKSQPQATIDEDTRGVDSIDGTYDEGKKSATVTITCEMSRWAAPPGSIIQLQNMGPWNGRWIVNQVDRSVFSRNGTITLKKPLPVLPEPSSGNLVAATTGTWTGGLTPDPKNDPSQNSPAAPGLIPTQVQIVTTAAQYLGVPYVWGGTDPKTGLDCSGFVQLVFKDLHIDLPRTTYDQVNVGTHIELGNIKAGDVIFTEPSPKGPQHEGLYVGNGKVQESPHTGDVNKYVPLYNFLGFAGHPLLVDIRRMW
jgi:cell wall-associated NlpC family hydrolase